MKRSPDTGLKLRVLVFCLITVALCYANSLPSPFIQDDHLIVAGNEEIRHVTPFRFLGEPYSRDQRFGGIYRPLTILSFSLDYKLWKEWAAGYRITNLFLHALNGWLLFLIAGGLLGSRSAAMAAAMVYLVHPVHTEAVVGIVGRSELLAAAFMLTAWLLFREGRTMWSALAFLLALLSKENAIMLPVVLLLEESSTGLRPWLRLFRRYAAFALVAFGYLALRLKVLGSLLIPAASQYLNGSLSTSQRLMTSGRAFLQYMRLIVAPVDVVGVYEFYSIPTASLRDWDAWLGLLLAGAMIATAVLISKTRPLVSFSGFFFFLTLLPVSNWVVPIGAIMAERFLYTPTIGVALLAAWLWTAIPNKKLQQVVGAGVLGIAAILCISHNYIWRDNVAFFGNMARVFPKNMSGRLGYGYALLDSGRLDEAAQQFEAAHDIAPMSPTVLADVAGLIVQRDPDQCDRVRPLLDGAFREQSNHWQSYWVLANCSAMKHQWEKAEEFYHLASTYVPFKNADLLFSWGVTLEALGKKDSAIEIYKRAEVIQPNDEEIKRRLASLAAKKP